MFNLERRDYISVEADTFRIVVFLKTISMLISLEVFAVFLNFFPSAICVFFKQRLASCLLIG